jgi:hypothetical protein
MKNIKDKRTNLNQNIKTLTTIMATVLVTGIGFKLDAYIKTLPPSWESQQINVVFSPLIYACDGTNCGAQEATGSSEIKEVVSKPQLSDRALDCVAKHIETANKISEKFGEYGQEAIELFTKESCLNEFAVNKSSGAAGLVQAYPASKLPCTLDDVDCQVDWGYNYIARRYGNAREALLFHLEKGWY